MFSDQKKENSPLPATVAERLVGSLVDTKSGSDPRSHNDGVVFWLRAGGASCASEG